MHINTHGHTIDICITKMYAHKTWTHQHTCTHVHTLTDSHQAPELWATFTHVHTHRTDIHIAQTHHVLDLWALPPASMAQPRGVPHCLSVWLRLTQPWGATKPTAGCTFGIPDVSLPAAVWSCLQSLGGPWGQPFASVHADSSRRHVHGLFAVHCLSRGTHGCCCRNTQRLRHIRRVFPSQVTAETPEG